MLSRRARRFTTSTLVAASAIGLLSTAPTAVADRRSPSKHARQAVPPRGSSALASTLSPQAARYRAQDLAWRGCLDRTTDPGLPAAYYALQCATLTAPLDWSQPDNGQQIGIAVSRLPASGPSAKGVLFTNPGGPGGAGIQLPLVFVSAGRKQLTRTQDIYGMDVRGTGDSSNVTCGGATSMTLDPRDRSADNLDLILDGAQLTARACDLAGGDLIDHVTTEQTVHDIDLLRAVVHAPKLNWLGYSAGTWLGAQYATSYPQNVGNMVLDSNVDFTGTWQDAVELEPIGFERRFREDFLPWVAKYHDLYGLGSTGNQVEDSYERIRSGMTADLPIDSPVGLDQLLAGSLYSKDLFPLAASVLADLNAFLAARQTADAPVMSAARHRMSEALPTLRRVALSAQPFASDASNAAFLAITCNDTPWTEDRAALISQSGLIGAVSPLIGWATIDQPCVFWHRPDGVNTPVPTGVGVPPVLMVQSEHDPATPIEGAQRAASRFAGARMLTVTDEGDHGLYAGGNSCVDKAVENFIILAKLPAEGATCPGQPLPDPNQVLSATAVGATKPAPPPRGTNPLVALRLINSLTP